MKKLVLLLVAGILPLSSACGQQSQTNNIDSQIDQVSSLAKKTKGPIISFTTYDIKGVFSSSKANTTKEEALNKAIHKINTDVIAFQEVESVTAFKTFSDKYLKDLKYTFYTRTNTSLGKINMAVLSKYPLTELKGITPKKVENPPALPGAFIYQSKIQINPDYSFNLYSTYIKETGAVGYSTSKRNSDIQKVKEYILATQKNYFSEKFSVVGNLGNTPESEDLKTILEPRSSGLSMHDVITEDLGDTDSTFTYQAPKGKSRQDYILVAAGMFSEYITNSVTIHKDTAKATDKFFAEASEHYPISVKIDLSLSDNTDYHR